MHLIGVFNRCGGTFRTLDMDAFVARARDIVAAEGSEIDCRVVDGESLTAELERAAADPAADAIVAGGGDGTISAAAGVCFDTGKALAVLPAGTMNLFARALRLPLDLEEAVRAIAQGRFYDVDIATANGRPFVLQYSVGIHARLIRIREELAYSNRWQKMFASLRAVSSVISKPLKFQVEVVSSHTRERRMASGIVISNNVIGEGHLPHADNIAGGVLGVYLARPMTPSEMARLIVRVLVGQWKTVPAISEREVTSVLLTFPRRKRRTHAVIDGELIPLEAQVDLKVHHKALKVLAPLALAEALGEDEDPAPAERSGAVTTRLSAR